MSETRYLRWWIKKIGRAGVALGGAPAVAVGKFRQPRAYALTYHRFGDVTRDPFCVSVESFEAQVHMLVEEGRAVSLSDIDGFVKGVRQLPHHACLITIDDGMVSTWEHAIPILSKHGAPAAVFVSSNLVGRSIDGAEEPYMDWNVLRQVADQPGISVGSHAHTHRSLGAMEPADARAEMETSRRILEDHLGRPVISFAYPFGTYGDFDSRTDRDLQDSGYSIAFNSVHGAIRPGLDPVSLPRVKVEGGEPLALFDLVSRGATVPWRLIDRNLWRFQRVRTERV